MAEKFLELIESEITTLATPEVARESAVHELAAVVINQRTQLVVSAVKECRSIDEQLKKIKPDQQSFNEAGEVVSESYSKQATESRRKLQEKRQKVEAALEKALASNDWDALAKALRD